MSGPTAVLFSGGVDSTVLLAEELARGRRVHPIHVRVGLAWEDAEARAITRLLAAAPFVGRARPGVTLTVDARDIYPSDHWARVGTPPAFDSPDREVYIEGRNLLLLAHAALWCRQHGVGRLALAPLAGNPFPDATLEFFAAMSTAVSLGLDSPIEIVAPYLALKKHEVVARGLRLGVPLEFTLSCMNPAPGDRHCGKCSKCRERQEGLASSPLPHLPSSPLPQLSSSA
jgi:7-cyano-7-deazaguanine synthase